MKRYLSLLGIHVEAYGKLHPHLYKFGFILRYPAGKEDVTGYSFEPWHIRYVGTKAVREIYENGWTLEIAPRPSGGNVPHVRDIQRCRRRPLRDVRSPVAKARWRAGQLAQRGYSSLG